MTDEVTPERLRPHLEAWLSGNHDRLAFAVHHTGPWAGAEQLVVKETYVDVRVCPSELAVREALAGPRSDSRALVLLCAPETLGGDVLARLAKPRVLRLQAWEAVQNLFDVREIDRSLLRERWMADALVESAPAGGYQKSGARELDADRAWRALLAHRYGIALDRGLTGLLEWAASPQGAKLAEVGEPERAAVIRRIESAFDGAAAVLAAARHGQGHRAVPLGVVARVLADGAAGEPRTRARTLLSVLLGNWSFDERDGRAWARAAEEEALRRDAASVSALLQASDRALAELQAEPLAAASDVLSAGLRVRLGGARSCACRTSCRH